MGCTSGCARKTFNDNLNELQVVESKSNLLSTIRKGLIYELMNPQDTVLCPYFEREAMPVLFPGPMVGCLSVVDQGLLVRQVFQPLGWKKGSGGIPQ